MSENKKQLTLLVNAENKEIAKKQGINLSKLVDTVLAAVVEIENKDQSEIKQIIQEKEDQIQKLQNEVIGLELALEEMKDSLKQNKEEIKQNKIFNECGNAVRKDPFSSHDKLFKEASELLDLPIPKIKEMVDQRNKDINNGPPEAVYSWKDYL